MLIMLMVCLADEQDDDNRDVEGGTDNGNGNVAIARPTQMKPLNSSTMGKLFLFFPAVSM